MRSSQVVRATGSQCQSSNPPGFEPYMLNMELNLQSLFGLHVLSCTQGVTKRCRLYLCWPISPSYFLRVQMRGERGSCGVSASENSCAHHMTWSPNKLRRSTSIFNLNWNPATPPPPRIWALIRGRYWSAKIDDISLFPPGSTQHSPTQWNLRGGRWSSVE